MGKLVLALEVIIRTEGVPQVKCMKKLLLHWDLIPMLFAFNAFIFVCIETKEVISNGGRVSKI